ncbi:hypothetical protein [Spirosoma aerolatum]|uniref:hypothetical protein n=1 Tax=Spirosoma aerolatum TaxID=1211326 RepID=UPI0009AEC5E5|nr:hypothetical protein [Spirosoma aerolatum]
MKVTSKSWVKLVLLVLMLPFLAAGAVYYVLIHNLNQIITFAVDKETQGGYVFQTHDLSLSLLHKTVTIDKLVFTRKDTTKASSYYSIKIPAAYLSVESWQELLINKRLLVDSFSVSRPEVVIHDYRTNAHGHSQTRFHTSSILENLQKTLAHLHAKSFNVQGGTFALYKRNTTDPFLIKDINLTVRNFSKIDNDDRRVLASDHIELALGRQKWVLSDGKNTLSFRGLHFISSTQLFEMDSVHFRKPATDKKGELSLRAEKFFFNSSHLPAVYQKGELWLDTLICLRPVLTLPIESRKDQVTDTVRTIQSNLKTLFKTVTIGYTQIKDGELLLGNKANPVSRGGTQKANMSIYNLVLNPQSEHSVSTDSINLSLRNIAFFSPDSLFKIGVESFHMVRNDVIFRNVLYGTASRKITGKGLTFKAPLLQLHDVSLEDLMQKRIVASAAELVQPSIDISATKKGDNRPKPFVVATATPRKVDLFKTLHGLGELLQVKRFQIINANAHYHLEGDGPMEVTMHNMNANVLLNDFLVSDSLIDIKHAIPTLTIADAHLTTNKVAVALKNYTLKGQQRYNQVDRLQVNLPNGTVMTASKVYWDAWGWDALQHSKDIQVELLRVHDLAIDARLTHKKPARPSRVPSSEPPPKPVPLLHIDQLMADHIALNIALSPQTQAGFQGTNVRIDRLSTETGDIGWEQFSGKLVDTYVNFPGSKRLSVAQIDLNSQQTSTLTDLRYTDNRPGQTMQVFVPQIQLKGLLNSTDFSTVRFHSLQINQPELTVVSKQQPTGSSAPPKAFPIPFTFTLHDLDVQGAKVAYTLQKDSSSIQVQSVVDIAGQSFFGAKDEALTFASLRIVPSSTTFSTPRLKTILPSSTIQLSNGSLSGTQLGRPMLVGHLQASLTASELRPVLNLKKSIAPDPLLIGHITAQIDYPGFSWMAGKKQSWRTWLDHTSLAANNVSFRGQKTAIDAAKLAWEPQNARLRVSRFRITPTMTKEEFMAPSRLQADYITVKGEEAQFNGLNSAQWNRDSSIAIHHVVVKNVTTDVSRDKRLPDPSFIPEKLMPTRLVRQVGFPFRIDSISVINSQVLYHETSKLTNRVGSVPLRNINGVLKNITNRPNRLTDSLVLNASTKLLGLHIDRLLYRESYGDSLAGFRMSLNTSGVHLPELTRITSPMIAANLEAGYAQPIRARVAGNRYASVGMMQLHYKDLKIHLLSPADTTKKTLLTRFKNFVVGQVIRKKNEADSRIFYDRDPQVFIFGYWIKTMLSGVMTSAGVKRNKKYHDSYLKLSQQRPLPAELE